MGLAEFKEIEDILPQTLNVQRVLVRKRIRRPTARKSFKPAVSDIIAAELESRFGRYICPEAATMLDKIDSVMCSVRNRALYRGVSPETRSDLQLLIRWKEEVQA